jgi:hypothetical protein
MNSLNQQLPDHQAAITKQPTAKLPIASAPSATAPVALPPGFLRSSSDFIASVPIPVPIVNSPRLSPASVHAGNLPSFGTKSPAPWEHCHESVLYPEHSTPRLSGLEISSRLIEETVAGPRSHPRPLTSRIRNSASRSDIGSAVHVTEHLFNPVRVNGDSAL